MKVEKIKDLSTILNVQKEAFRKEAEKHNDMMMPPMIQTQQQIEEEFNTGTIFFKYEKDNHIIGSVRGKLKDDICKIGRLVVKPEFQNQGVGKSLMFELEAHFKHQCRKFQIFTGEKSEHALGLYTSLGYKISNYQNVGSYNLIYMEKEK